jgi:hypothetical protein
VRRYTELEASVVATAARLARAGLRPKNLRAMKSAVDREGGLIEQVMLPSLRSHREQRQEALDALEELVQAMSQLHQLLLTRYIRRLTV